MHWLKKHLLLMTVLPFLSSCAVQINDEQFCSPIPGGNGAICDNFLTSNQMILSEADWQALQASWINSGNAVECTTSKTVGDIKKELEQLCSVAKCDDVAQKKIVDGLNKIQSLGAP